MQNLKVWVGGLLLIGSVAMADIDDVETDMEDALANSEAAKEGAVAAKRRAEQERRNTEKAKIEAQNAATRAKSKEREAKLEISALERQIERDRATTHRLLGEKTAFENQIQKLDKQISTYKAKAEKQKIDKEAAQKIRDEKRDQTATLIQQAQLLESEMRKTKDEERMAIQELEKAKKDEKESAARLKQVQDENKKNLLKLQSRVDEIRNQANQSKEAAALSESKMREVRQNLNRAQTDAEFAEAEADQAKRRAEESDSRLKELKARNQARAAELKSRRVAAESKASQIDEDTTAQRIELAESGQVQDHLETSADSAKVNVKLEKKSPAQRQTRKLAVSCSLLEKPMTNAKVVGARRKGTSLMTETLSSGWTKVLLDSKTAAYVPATCFEGRTPSMQ